MARYVLLASMACLIVAVPCANPLPGQEIPNLDFASATPSDPTVPSDWFVGGGGYEVALDTVAYTGTRSLRMRRQEPGGFGVVSQAIPSRLLPPPGSVVRVSGYIRTADVRDGWAGLWLRMDGPDGRLLSLDNMSDHGATGTRDWTRYSVSAVLPTAAERVVFGALMPGGGTAWFDALEVEYEESVTTIEGARALTARGAENLVAFSRLLGYVRYFHPTDEAEATDWSRFAIEGVRAVEDADGPERLAAVLDSLFRPIAPTLVVRRVTEDLSADPVEELPVPAEATGVVTWGHFGLGGASTNVYRSTRNRTELDPRAPTGTADDSREPLVREIAEGVEVVLPLAVYADEEGTLPRGTAATAGGSDSPPWTGDDRATRLAAVAHAWNVFQHFYPYFDVVPTDWEAELPRALRAAAADEDACAFVETLELMVAALHDGHGRVSGVCMPPVAQPAFAVDWVQGAPVVTHVDDPSSGVRPGDLILEVDGRSWETITEEQAARISSATAGWTRSRLRESLLAGAFGSPIELTIERMSGEVETVGTTRSANAPPTEPRPDVIEEIEPGIWYVDLTRVEMARFRGVLGDLEEAGGIVFEMRGYPTGAARLILNHLIQEPRTSAQWHIPVVVRPDREDLVFLQSPGWNLQPAEPFLEAPKVFLTHGGAISYAESVMGIVEAYEIGTIVGHPTAGTNGNVNPIRLPGGYRVSWTGMKVLKHDGSQHHGVGILPDVPVERTREGVAAGRDEFLERALDVLRDR